MKYQGFWKDCIFNINLDLDEGIILQTSEVERYGLQDFSLDEMILTNKNIICVYTKSNGLFVKSDIITEKISLSSIKVVNGQAQVMLQNSDDYGKGIQVLFVNGNREHFVFNNSPKKQIPLWINSINKAVIGDNEPIEQVNNENIHVGQNDRKSKGKRNKFSGIKESLNGGLSFDAQKVIEKTQSKILEFSETVDSKIQFVQEKQLTGITKINESQKATDIERNIKEDEQSSTKLNEEVDNDHIYCSNCGTKLYAGAKFCHGCGVAVDVGTKAVQLKSIAPVEQNNYRSERQQEYVGKVFKCPHCGGVINEIAVICPECGMQISGKVALSSVQSFKEQLMMIENTRKNKVFGALSLSVDPADMKKLSLIRNFPIPNTVDDILEFMLLAIANIDVSLSKKNIMNKYYDAFPSGETSSTIGRSISNAWVAKMQQIYKKAEVLFPNEPVFQKIQDIYFAKMEELKIKIK